MLNSTKKWLGSLAGVMALSLSGLAYAADSPFPAAPSGTPVAGAVGLGILAVGALALGIRHAKRSK